MPVPPRLTPYLRSLRGHPDWKWRSMEATAEDLTFVLLATLNTRKGEYRAWLLQRLNGDLRLLARLEDHGNHPGLHCHVWCPGELPAPGTPSIDAPNRLPRRKSRRSSQGATADAFWATACLSFAIIVPSSPTIQEKLL